MRIAVLHASFLDSAEEDDMISNNINCVFYVETTFDATVWDYLYKIFGRKDEILM